MHTEETYLKAVSQLLEIVTDQFSTGGDAAVDWLAVEQAINEMPSALWEPLINRYGYKITEEYKRVEDRDGRCYGYGTGVYAVERNDEILFDDLRSEDHALGEALDHLAETQDNIDVLQTIADLRGGK